MKILVLTGSPHRKGTSALLADEFIRGAEQAGHEVRRFDTAFKQVGGCLACDKCRGTGSCVQRDDFAALCPSLLEADLVAFVTPFYYFGMSAQLKRTVDRFYSVNDKLMEQRKQTVLLATCGDTDPRATDALEAHYDAVCRYLGWRDAGRVLAHGVDVRKEIEASDFPARAFALGAGLG